MQDFINKFWERTIAPSLRKIINENRDNSERIVSSINEISNEEITSAQEDTTKAIEGVKETIESISYEPIQEKLDTLIQTVQEKDLSVSVGETIIDTKGIIESIQELKKAIPSLPKQIDYTNSFEKLLTAFAEYTKDDEKENKSSHRILVEQLLGRLATTQDISVLADWLKVISEKEEIEYPFKFSDSGRLLVEVDKIGSGGGGGLVRTESEALISLPKKQDAIISAINGISGVSSYNFVQSEETATYKYYGFASDTGWQIKRKTLATGVWEQATGTGDYETAWADRASKTYTYA